MPLGILGWILAPAALFWYICVAFVPILKGMWRATVVLSVFTVDAIRWSITSSVWLYRQLESRRRGSVQSEPPESAPTSSTTAAEHPYEAKVRFEIQDESGELERFITKA